MTLGVDVQKDRLEAMMCGWGRSRQCWVVKYWTLPGNPALKEDKCWNDLDAIIQNDYMVDGGELMNITSTFIDQQFLTDSVNSFCEQFEYNRDMVDGVYPVLAREQMQGLVRKMDSGIGAPVIGIADQPFKKTIYDILRKRRPHGDGTFPHSYIHFSNEYGIDFYKQLLAEEYVTEKNKYGHKKTLIANIKQRRNEVLDVMKYNYANFQFIVSEFFDVENKKRRANKQREMEIDLDYFFDVLEDVGG